MTLALRYVRADNFQCLLVRLRRVFGAPDAVPDYDFQCLLVRLRRDQRRTLSAATLDFQCLLVRLRPAAPTP